MKIFLVAMLLVGGTYASQIIIDNQSTYPKNVKNTKIAIQWAASAHDIENANQTILNQKNLQMASLYPLTQRGKISVMIPKNVHNFRILVWSQDKKTPDLLTNWVLIVPKKIYKLTNDLLTPTILLNGAGC